MRVPFFLAAIYFFCLTSHARADKIGPPESYTSLSADKKFIFVMLSEQPGNVANDKLIRDTYKKSGLYKNDGTNELLWTVDWYAASISPQACASCGKSTRGRVLCVWARRKRHSSTYRERLTRWWDRASGVRAPFEPTLRRTRPSRLTGSRPLISAHGSEGGRFIFIKAVAGSGCTMTRFRVYSSPNPGASFGAGMKP